MSSIKAIFMKQARDAFKNATIFIQFILFPIMAYAMTEMMAKPNDDIPNSMFVTMFGAMFAGMTPLTLTAMAIAEDKEHKSIRFLSMAGVKPHHYLSGIAGFILLASALVSVVFGLIGEFSGVLLAKFIFVLFLSSVASALLGATVGVFAKNQQAATALATPISIVVALFPTFAEFNESLARVANLLFTQQASNILNSDPTASMASPLLIIFANIAVFLVLFVLAYKKKGLNS